MPPTIAFFIDPSLQSAWPRIWYILDLLERHPLAPTGLRCLFEPQSVPTDAKVCYYGTAEKAPAGSIVIPAQHFFFRTQPIVKQSFTLGVFPFREQTLYAASSAKTPPTGHFFQDNTFGFDWLETLFFHLTRWEEYAPAAEETDAIGLMKSSAQFLPRNGLHHIPVVDQLVAAVFEVLGFSCESRATTFSLSHDVDDLQVFGPGFRLLRYLGGIALRHRTLRGWPQVVSDVRNVRSGRQLDPGDTFDWLLRLAPTFRKTIYFGMGNHSPLDHFPDLDAPRLLEVRDMALELGYDLGIHPSFNTWKNTELLRQECRTAERWLGAPLTKSRQHYLHFAFPETADALETAGIQEDATLGYRDRIGFRAGTGFPYHLYCFREERPYAWIEQPLVAMDVGLLREGGANPERIRQLWTTFLSQNKRNTAISLSLHNTFPYEQGLHGIDFRELFGTLLSSQNNWM